VIISCWGFLFFADEPDADTFCTVNAARSTAVNNEMFLKVFMALIY
jgi:hypothetical protein